MARNIEDFKNMNIQDAVGQIQMRLGWVETNVHSANNPGVSDACREAINLLAYMQHMVLHGNSDNLSG